jgi:hypothetical protein
MARNFGSQIPIGPHLLNGATVCCDPITWFQRKLIRNPSAFILGLTGLGKSTFTRRLIVGLTAWGVMALILGDIKGEHVAAARAVGGQVISLGRGRGSLNILDLGEARVAAERLRQTGHPAEADALLKGARNRRAAVVSALLTVARSGRLSDREEIILTRALTLLDEQHRGVPVLGDLLALLRSKPPELREVSLDRGEDSRYDEITEDLETTLLGLCGAGRMGDMFAQPTTEPMRRDRAVVFDVSSIEEEDKQLQAAALIACWAQGFGTVDAAQALADAGVEERRHYFVVNDEMWRALRLGHGLVDRYDALTRLNRQIGIGQISISHTMKDLMSMPDVAEQQAAKGLVERAGFLVLGGLPRAEMPLLRQVVDLSQAEEDLLVSWGSPPEWDPRLGQEAEPPGMGRFLLKVGGRAGVPVRLRLTERERHINDTNLRWHEESRVGRVDDSPAE